MPPVFTKWSIASRARRWTRYWASNWALNSVWQVINAVLPAGGGLLVAEKVLDDTNLAAQMQNLNMLVVTEGRERTAIEYTVLLNAAGFYQVEHRITGAPLDAILGIKLGP